MTPKTKKIIIVIVAIVLVIFGYYMFSNKKEKEETKFLVTTSSSEMSEKNKILGQKITKTLVQINDIGLDKSIFDNKVFLSLVDRRVKIDKQTAGRKNPFAPLSDTSVNYESKSNPEVGDESGSKRSGNSVNNVNVTTGSTTPSTTTRSTSSATSTQSGSASSTVR